MKNMKNFTLIKKAIILSLFSFLLIQCQKDEIDTPSLDKEITYNQELESSPFTIYDLSTLPKIDEELGRSLDSLIKVSFSDPVFVKTLLENYEKQKKEKLTLKSGVYEVYNLTTHKSKKKRFNF